MKRAPLINPIYYFRADKHVDDVLINVEDTLDLINELEDVMSLDKMVGDVENHELYKEVRVRITNFIKRYVLESRTL